MFGLGGLADFAYNIGGSMIRTLLLAAIASATLASCGAQSGGGANRDEIRIVGSSTVFPFAKAVAERFTASSEHPSPILESTGTGGGMKLFCSGVGTATPDIANASRRIKESEFQQCQANGVTEIVEIQIGIDGIVVASAKDGIKLALTQEQIYRAIAANPFGKKNMAESWSDIDPSLPDTRISVYGPPSTSGTRDALTELIMEAGCRTDEATKELEFTDPDKFKAICHEVRTDGPYVDAGENDNLIVQKLKANPNSVGIFGYSFLEENGEEVTGIAVDGVDPSYDAIASGDYPGARPLYIYVKKQHIGKIPGLQEYLKAFVAAGGSDGYLRKEGLIASPDEMRSLMQQYAEELPTLQALDVS